MDILKHASSFNGNLSNEAIQTFKGIAQSIHEHSLKTPWDRANEHMRGALIEAFNMSADKKEFIKNAKKKTGLLKNDDPLIVQCIQTWFQ